MTTSDVVKHPKVLWAQDKSNVFVTIEVFEAKEEKIQLEANRLSFSCQQAGLPGIYAVDLELYGEIKPDFSSKARTDRHWAFVLVKELADAPFWPRLLKSTVKAPFLATDFSKWRDEDEMEEEEKANPFANMGGMPPGFDLSQFANMPGAADDSDEGEDEEEEYDDPYGFNSKKGEDLPPPLEDDA